MTCAIYGRVSSSEQAENKCSVPAQIAKCKEFAKKKAYTILGIFTDEGRSGSDAKRPGLLDMMAFCDKNKVEKILLLDTDRLARDESLHFGLKTILKKRGTTVESVNQPMLDESPEGKFLDSILAAVNALYPKITARKTAISMQEKISLGWWPGPAPFGFKNAKNSTPSCGFDKNIVIKDEIIGPFVTRMFELFSTGAYTADTVSQKLFEEGLRSRTGKMVKKSEICHRLRNIFYVGKIRYKGVVYPGRHEPLTNIKIFEKCQMILDEHNNFADRKRKHKFILSGCIVCDICGKTYTADKHGNVDYYHCPSNARSHSNRRQNIKTEELEKYIEKLFKTITLSSSLISRIRERAKYKLSDIHSNIDDKKRLLCLRKQQLEERRRTLEIKYLDGKVSDDTYTRQSIGITEELKEINGVLVKIDGHREDNIKIFERLVELSRDLFTVYKNADPDQRKFYVNLFWDEIRVKNKQIKKAVPTLMFQTLLNSKSIKFNESRLTGSFRKSLNWLPGSDSNGQPAP